MTAVRHRFCAEPVFRKWYEARYCIGKTKITPFVRKTSSDNFNYKLCNNLVSRSLVYQISLSSYLYFHYHSNYIFFQCLKMLG
jgi:hypothetical protein